MEPVQHPNLRASPMIVGGLFLGFWLYLDFFRIPAFGSINLVLWNFWGAMGLAVAGGLYASRIANSTARIIIWILLGIALGFLAMVLIFNQVGEAFAALFTVAGAGLIVTGLPGGWTLPPVGGDQWQDANGQAR
ncbi:MAG: hypothetical protein QOG31_601 [Thermoplasmata archaeon]|jgi:hypothetical protein|nr:hypothetical protein [Thermoplasmata archaeon]